MSSTSPQQPPTDASITTKQLPSQRAESSFKKQPSGTTQRQHPLDAKFDRLIRDVFPPAPYLLRLRHPSAQYHGRDRYYWRKDTHFQEDEEELQYLTFRPNHDGTILYAHGQWDDGNGSMAPKDFPSSQASSGQTPSTGLAPKKKITLADYAKMDKTKPATPNTNDASITQAIGPIEKTSREPSEAPKKEAVKVDDEVHHDLRAESVLESAKDDGNPTDRVLKRSADTMTGTKDTTVVDQEIPSPPVKKPRHSDKSIKSEDAKAKQAHEIKSGNSKTITPVEPEPKGLEKPKHKEHTKSPSDGDIASIDTLPVKKTKEALLHGLPPMLSPTLPAEIEEELAKLTPGLRGGLTSSRAPSLSPSVYSKERKRDASTDPKSKPSSENRAPSTPKQSSRDPKQITSAPRQQHEDDDAHSNLGSKASKKSKIVKIKIKNKKNRSTLINYLRMRPTPNRGSGKTLVKSGLVDVPSDHNSIKSISKPKPSKAIRSPEESESSGNDEPLATQKSSKRRVTGLDDVDFGRSQPKRAKGSEQASLPQDPSSTKSVAATPKQAMPNSAQKSHLSVKSTAMQRTASQESAATPARDNTPTANGHKPESPDRREWKNNVRLECNRLVKLATDIKHESDDYLKRMIGREYEEHRQLGSVLATEASLCFVLAAIVSDEPDRSTKRHSDPALWKSTRDFMSSLSSTHAKKFQYLYGFLKQVEGVVGDTIAYQHDMRGEAILREYYRLKHGEATATAVTNPDSYIAENWSFLKDAQETRMVARSAWRDGQLSLYIPDLEQEFPKTWSQRRKFAGRGKGRDPVTLKNYGKEGFALPLGVNSTALDVVNFGLSFLGEFCEKEGIKWKPRLIL